MAIKNISKLKKFGIFDNFENSKVQDFGKFNLFYGWNGSGKSTLSSLFHCIESKKLSEKFPTAEFTVNIEGSLPVTHSNVASTSLNICTFNQDFIDENISWNSIVKSILLVDKEKIAEREKLESLKKQQIKDVETNIKEIQKINEINNERAKFGTDSARHIKTSLQSIDTTDKYYLNYNKVKFEQFIGENLEATKSATPLLNEQNIINLTNASRPDQKSEISTILHKIDSDIFAKAKVRLLDLLKTSVVSKTIKRLIEHSDIKSWVETGIKLHKHHDSNECEFCGNSIAKSRLEQLDAHFNDDYKAFQDRLVKAEEWLTNQYIQKPQLPAGSDFYDEFKNDYIVICKTLEKAIKTLNDEIAAWHLVLRDKISNPLETNLTVEPILQTSVDSFNGAITELVSIIGKHNYKSANFKTETTKAKKQLELHFATTEVTSFKYHEKKKSLAHLKNENDKLNTTINARNVEIGVIENSLSNEGMGADQFNESLHKFLGRSELTLRFNPSKKGYEILRNAMDPVGEKLSEGEKTAIAFVYFITKLKENDNKIENTIVVVDDPVSSFDSNHLFHAYSFLRSNCNSAKQLFVFTHNFTYFKLIRDWFEGGNRNRTNRKPPKDVNAFFFTIEATTSIPRQSTIKNSDPSLVKFNSEYHYIFSRLYNYKDNPALNRDDAFLTANLSRKLIESFFSFKYPKNRSDISQLMSSGLTGCKITDESTKEKIYRFINKYSHSAVIEINEDSSDNLLGESYNVIGDIFTWMNEVDEVHYNEMVGVVNEQ